MNSLAITNLFYFLLFIFFSTHISASSVNVGILTDYRISSLTFSSQQGEYYLIGDGKPIVQIESKGSIFLQVSGDSILVKKQNIITGIYKTVKLIGKNVPNSFGIKPIKLEKPMRIFDHNLELSVNNKYFRLINRVNIEYYVAGVVEAENGIRQNYEYYKMKSIICRTYALNNLSRHETEGYNLCDQVHCQVYKAKSRLNKEILLAALGTTGTVIVDTNLQLITAAFHSNCGGQTLNSEEVWSLPTTYLKSVRDTFCLKQPNAIWEHKIAIKDWENYLKQNFQLFEDSTHSECTLSYYQNEREVDFISHDIRIPLKKIRGDFRLKSTYFIFDPEKEFIVLKGRGFGHGLGLCQEGAMRMAQLGFSYDEILHFYYKDVHLVDLSALEFFQEK